MPRRNTLFSIFISILCMFTAGWPAAEEQTLSKLSSPYKAPAFDLQGEDGKRYRLADYQGKVVILNFWATWCPPCRFEMPSMERAWQKLKAEGQVVLLAINVGEDADTIFTFLGDYPVTFPLPMDKTATIIEQYKVVGLPSTFIINPKGWVTHRAVGSREWDDEGLLSLVREMAKQEQRP